MSNIFRELNFQLKNGSVLTKLILVNVLIFVLVNFLWLISFLSGNGNYLSSILIKWLALPADINQLLYKPWTLFSYMFLHQELMHVLFNCLFLYFGGRLFQDFLGSKRVLPVYLLGGLSGAILFMLAFNIFPVFNNALYNSFALGASASALALLIALAAYLPEMTVHLILFGPVRLKWIAVIVVLLDFLSITRGNAGGHIAHIGGALFGLIYAQQLKRGNDIALFLQKIIEKLNSLLNKPKKIRVAHKSKYPKPQSTAKPKQEIIDQILDKISRSGYDSLSKEEKELLFKLSKED